jgi:hypothetical protein
MQWAAKTDMRTGRVVAIQFAAETFEDERILGHVAGAMQAAEHRIEIVYKTGDDQLANISIATKDKDGNPHIGGPDET